jgi:hypothetical protein
MDGNKDWMKGPGGPGEYSDAVSDKPPVHV